MTMVSWLYRWLPIFCGCHCRPDRSFFFRGRQFPVCARCTGMLLGFVLSAALYAVWHPSLLWGLFLLLPATVDGVVQLKTPYESRNRRRLWTGFLGGYGGMLLMIGSFVLTYRLGMRAGFALLGA